MPDMFDERIVEAYTRFWSDYSMGMVGSFWKLVRKHSISPGALADVACGDGTFLSRVADSIPWVCGVDQSAAMLRAAKKNELARRKVLAAAGTPMRCEVVWLEADMREFELPRSVDVVTCWYNSLNYMLTVQDLSRALDQIRESLRPGGFLLCDVYTRQGMASEWQDRTWVAVDADDCYVSSRTRYDPHDGLGEVHFTGFLRDDEGRYERFDETHQNRAYPLDTLESAFRAAGFDICEVLTIPRLKAGSEQDSRVAIVAAAVG